MVGPLGVAKGAHKEMGFQVAIGNLGTDKRFKMESIMLPTLVPTHVYKKQGWRAQSLLWTRSGPPESFNSSAFGPTYPPPPVHTQAPSLWHKSLLQE